MRMLKRPTLALIAIAVTLAMVETSAQKGYDLFQQALVKERAEGKPEEAIALYQRIVKEAGADRSLAAKALVEMARCYEKLGSLDAQKTYERVVREYADQTGPASEARAALSAPVKRAANPVNATTHRADSLPHRIEWPQNAVPSPDGHALAIESGDDLVVRVLATGEGRTLTHAGKNEGLCDVAWSSNSQRLAYAWCYEGDEKKPSFDVKLVGQDASDSRTLASRLSGWPTALAWSIDGRTVAVQVAQESAFTLRLVSVADGSMREINTRNLPMIGMAFSPDGRSLAFSVPNPSGTMGIFALDLSGGTERPLILDSSENQFAAWTPNGGLLFASDRAGTWDLWLARLTNGRIDGAPVKLKTDVGPLTSRTLTNAGTLYYVTGNGNFRGTVNDVYMVSVDPATSKVLSPPAPAHQGIGHSALPIWSADGRQLAFKSGPNGPLWPTISILTLDTGEERRLTPKILALAPRYGWSPDGKVFVDGGNPETKARGGQWNLYRVDVHTGDLSVISTGQAGGTALPQWSPDGRSVIYRKGEQQVVRRDLETGQEQSLVQLPTLITAYALSPDGASIAYLSARDEKATKGDLHVTVLADGRTRTLVEYQGQLVVEPSGRASSGLAWSPDSRYVLYFDQTADTVVPGTTTKRSELWRVPVGGGAPERLGLTGDVYRDPVISPDGRRLAFVKVTERPGVWALENVLSPSELARSINSEHRR
jgi:Tol biopolymer transport system component